MVTSARNCDRNQLGIREASVSLEELDLLVGCGVLALGQHLRGTRGLLSAPFPVTGFVSAGQSCCGGPHSGLGCRRGVWADHSAALELPWPPDLPRSAGRGAARGCSLPWALKEVAQVRALSKDRWDCDCHRSCEASSVHIKRYCVFQSIRLTPPNLGGNGGASYSPNVAYLACWGVGGGRAVEGFFPIFLL